MSVSFDAFAPDGYPDAPPTEIGLLKMDFLGLKTLTVLQKAGAESVGLITDPPDLGGAR